MIVVAKTNLAAAARGTSLMLVERGMPGFQRGQAPEEIGHEGTGHLRTVLRQRRSPENLLGGKAWKNKGFICLMEQLPVGSACRSPSVPWPVSQAAIDWTVDYVKERKVFGQPVAAFQNTPLHPGRTADQVQVARCSWTSAAS